MNCGDRPLKRANFCAITLRSASVSVPKLPEADGVAPPYGSAVRYPSLMALSLRKGLIYLRPTA